MAAAGRKAYDVVTLFPEMFSALSEFGITGRAQERKLYELNCWNPRDFTEDRHRTVDDRPYGGGPRMVMLPGPLEKSISAAKARQIESVGSPGRVIYLSPQGRPLNHQRILELVAEPAVLLLCGRYEDYANYGTYSVTLIATNANGSDTLVFPNYITINQNPPAPVITLNGNLLISTPAISYQWFLNNTPIPGGVNQVQPLTSVGSYYVLITDSNGCQSASNLLVVSGIEQTSPSQNFNIKTNTNHELVIDNIGLLNEPFQVSICDIEGRLVMKSTINTTTQARINIASLTEGVYLTTIYNAWSQTVLKFVIK